tara:strand:- start:14694 stop:15287 length:594 start_codon:yes stop_codon:yes gene_type:complete
MSKKFDRFFESTPKFLNDIVNAIGKPVDSDVTNDIGHIIVDAIDHGYTLCMQDNGTANDILEDDTYRKGVIVRFDGNVVEHSSTTYVKITSPDGHTSDFNLRNIPEFKHIEAFYSHVIQVTHDEDMIAFAEQNKPLAEAMKTVGQIAEKIYWRKVAKAITQHHQNLTRDKEARTALLAAGFSNDEVESYIPTYASED